MKIGVIAFLLAAQVGIADCMAETRYSAVAMPGKRTVVAGVRRLEPGYEIESALQVIRVGRPDAAHAGLPREIGNREIVALLPLQDGDLLVVTQWTLEQGDAPQVHAWSPATGKWEFVATVDCPALTAIESRGGTLRFKGEGGDREVALAGRKAVAGVIPLPQDRSRKGDVTARIPDMAHDGTRLVISTPSGRKTYSPGTGRNRKGGG